jgi:hypothetical protein
MRYSCEVLSWLADKLQEFAFFIKRLELTWRTTPPKNHMYYHHPDCFVNYRGCHTTKCPKDQYEKTGKWRFSL